MSRRMLAMAGTVMLLTTAATSSCSSTATDPCASIPVDDFKELMVVDESITGDAQGKNIDSRALNANDGPWSFRHLVESIAPDGMDPGEFVRTWFLEWVTTTTYNGYAVESVDPGARATAMNDEILCPWMLRTPSNGCNSDCSKCSSNPPKLDLAQAPFRMAAIVNRVDLRGQPDLGKAGEARIVFSLVHGPADDPASYAMPMTLIFEFSLPDSKTPQDWANAWHSLGTFTSFDDSFKNALAAFTESWVARGAAPEKQNGSALSQVRTNEAALDWDWQQRQFELGKDGHLHVAGLRDTPPEDLNGSQTLADYINKNAASIMSGVYAMPPTMLSGSSDFLTPWAFPGMDEKLRHAFATNTCNGCHTQEQQFIDTAFHVSPFRSGTGRLSPYVYDPTNRASDQLTLREADLRAALCGN